MCMEDIRIGRSTGPATRFVAVPDAGNTKLCDADTKRTALIIAVTSATAAIIAPRPLNPSAGEGGHLSQGEGWIMLDVVHHGTLVTQEWRASGDAGASSVMVLESFLNKE